MTEDLIKHDATLLSMVRRNMKYQFYAFANSAASNVKTERVIPAWEGALIGGSIATGVIAVGLVVLMVILKMKAFKQN
jgi:beta-glucosidase